MKHLISAISLIFILAVPLHAADRPNIVLVMADDQGWGDTAYNGHPELVTPHLDAMAKAGLRFDHFYAAAPVCSPTRGSVMTGRHPNRFGCFTWGRTLRPQEITIAERLKDAGYATGHFGKWHIGSVLRDSPVSPGNSGFDQWFSAFNFYDNDPVLSRNGTAVEIKGESSIIAADAAIDFIRQSSQKNQPFLAVVWFGSPHSPHRAAQEDLAHYPDINKPHWHGEITGLDRAVGKLRQALRDENLHENTLFWYTSDNGGLKEKSSGGRGKKGSIYEGGLRVPAIIEWPARIKQARITKAPANTVDIYPTVMDLLGIKLDDQPQLDGISLVPVIDGKSETREGGMGFWSFAAGGIGTPSDQWMKQELAAQKAGKPYHSEARLMNNAGAIEVKHPSDKLAGHAAWNAWPWKLHRIPNKKGDGKPKLELYNLAEDPMEKTDLAAKQPERVKKMSADLETWMKSVIGSLNGDDYSH